MKSMLDRSIVPLMGLIVQLLPKLYDYTYLLLDPFDQLPQLHIVRSMRDLPPTHPGVELAPRHPQQLGHLLHVMYSPMLSYKAAPL